jgi:hypothetical protein
MPLNLTGAKVFRAGLTMSGVRAPQAFAVDATTGSLFTLQVSALPRALQRGHLVVTRISLTTGKRTGSMALRGFGHGVAFGVEPCKDSASPYLWVECGPLKRLTDGTVRGTSIARVLFRPGSTLTASAVESRLGFGHPVTCSVDIAAGQLGVRGAGETTIYDLGDAAAGKLTQIAQISGPSFSGVFQGWTLHAGHVYSILGKAGQAARLARTDLATGKTVTHQTTIRPRGHWEPEGIGVIGGRLVFGGSYGSGRRRLRLYRTA